MFLDLHNLMASSYLFFKRKMPKSSYFGLFCTVLDLLCLVFALFCQKCHQNWMLKEGMGELVCVKTDSVGQICRLCWADLQWGPNFETSKRMDSKAYMHRIDLETRRHGNLWLWTHNSWGIFLHRHSIGMLTQTGFPAFSMPKKWSWVPLSWLFYICVD